MFNIKTALNPGWKRALKGEFEQPYIKQLERFLDDEYSAHKTIYPPRSELFSAFNSTPPEKVRVVIIGQDPYHGEGQAHGLCFSVRPGVRIPPSLRNIFKELHSDLGISTPEHGYLQSWTDQGVFLLNATLSVEAGAAGSHQKRGWESFTDAVIRHMNDHKEGLVFLLWGSYAQKKGAFIDTERHLVLTAPHPSPLSAHRGFLGCGHFSSINHYLSDKGEKPIDWSLPPSPLQAVAGQGRLQLE
ncbi:MAG: uracil-DNA glycosylase [Sedimenticola sp.]